MLVTDTIAATLTKLGGPRHAETTRSGDIRELVNAAMDSKDRGETLDQFLDHAALVSDADAYDERARVPESGHGRTSRVRRGVHQACHRVGCRNGRSPYNL